MAEPTEVRSLVLRHQDSAYCPLMARALKRVGDDLLETRTLPLTVPPKATTSNVSVPPIYYVLVVISQVCGGNSVC